MVLDCKSLTRNKVDRCQKEIFEQMISGHIWSRCVLNLWPFDFKMKPVQLCPELHLSCTFDEIPTAVLKNSAFTDF